MENSDVFSSSTAPLTWHDFLERMRHPSAAEFVKAIKSFIVSFLNNAPDAERDSAAVQEFLGNMEAAFRAHSLWAGSSEEELESAGEGLEKYVMTKLFTRVFASISEDVKADDQLHGKMALIQQFIRPEYLDIKLTYQNETSWLLAQKELQKINMYKAPRDKLVCILNCCKVISNLLLNASLASNKDHPGADEFLPVLIYVTIKANPPQLHSNLSYIQRFRRETRLVSEAAYFFTNMLSVESFISNINAKALSMDETEYEQNMESARSLLSGLSDTSDNSHNQSNQKSQHVPKPEPFEPKAASSSNKHQPSRNDNSYEKDQLNKIPSISDLENKGATMLLKENDASQIFHEFPFLYSQAEDLTVGDVDDLLNNYKQLVFKYVCLARGVGKNPRQPEIAKGSENRSESNVKTDIPGENPGQHGIGKDLDKRSEFNLNMDTPSQNPEQHEIGKDLEKRIESNLLGTRNPEKQENGNDLLENKSEANTGDDTQKEIISGGVEDSVEGWDLGLESTKSEVAEEEVNVQNQGDEGSVR